MPNIRKLKNQAEIASALAKLAFSPIVNSDTSVSDDSSFSDPIWYMESKVSLPGVKECKKKWDYRTIPGFPAGFALTLAEYAYARLYRPVESHGRTVTWLTVYNNLGALREFSYYCYEYGCQRLSDVTQELLDGYFHLISHGQGQRPKKSEKRVKRIITDIYTLWQFSSSISEPLEFQPFSKPIEKLFKRTSSHSTDSENSTPVIPEPIYGPLMAAALDYVLHYSPTLISSWKDLLQDWNEQIAPAGLSSSGATKRIAKTAKKILARHDTFWLKKPWKSYGDLYQELHQLRNACTIIILAYSGIRVSELLSLKAGCCVTDSGVDGKTRHYINTIVHKHRDGGSNDSWVVIGEVVTAIHILETLTARIRYATGEKKIIISDKTNAFFSVGNSFANKKISELTDAGVLYHLYSFQRHINKKLNRQEIPVWPNEDGELRPWHFNTRQFRRTLARYIARQPFGVIAGMLQFKHVEVALFEGYAGCEPEWNKMLDEEKLLASINILDEVAIDLSNGTIAGEFGTSLKDEFSEEFKGRAENFPPSQIAKWLANTKKDLFIGKFNFCFFDPVKADCIKEQKMKSGPVLNFCQPGHCKNACVTNRHRPLWEAQLEQAEEFLSSPNSSPMQHRVLDEEVRQLRFVVHKLRKE